jgi:acetoin utilization deacetylase AcuC-like enzyme
MDMIFYSKEVKQMNKLPVFYSPKQSVSDNTSFSPSAGKPEKIVQLFGKSNRINVVDNWAPVSKHEIAIAHDPKFVDDIMSLRKINGFGNTLASVANSLPYTVGSFLRAAEHALSNDTVAMSPTSGFHHSCYSSCGGFCTFNGLMVTAFQLWKQGVGRIGIIDFDAHYGNGTQDIIDRFEGADKLIEHYTFGGFAHNDDNFDDWLLRLPAYLNTNFRDCDILLYQAGADPHINDPLGGYLSTEQMKVRDDIVFQFAARHRKPIVWNLAGGYQDPISKVLTLHENTLRSCLEHYVDAT